MKMLHMPREEVLEDVPNIGEDYLAWICSERDPVSFTDNYLCQWKIRVFSQRIKGQIHFNVNHPAFRAISEQFKVTKCNQRIFRGNQFFS